MEHAQALIYHDGTEWKRLERGIPDIYLTIEPWKPAEWMMVQQIDGQPFQPIDIQSVGSLLDIEYMRDF